MGLRQKLIEVLSRGNPPELDPDELIHLEFVPLPNGPMTVETLKDSGIDAVSVDAFDAVTARSSASIMVPRHQVDEATAVLDALR